MVDDGRSKYVLSLVILSWGVHHIHRGDIICSCLCYRVYNINEMTVLKCF